MRSSYLSASWRCTSARRPVVLCEQAARHTLDTRLARTRTRNSSVSYASRSSSSSPFKRSGGGKKSKRVEVEHAVPPNAPAYAFRRTRCGATRECRLLPAPPRSTRWTARREALRGRLRCASSAVALAQSQQLSSRTAGCERKRRSRHAAVFGVGEGLRAGREPRGLRRLRGPQARAFQRASSWCESNANSVRSDGGLLYFTAASPPSGQVPTRRT